MVHCKPENLRTRCTLCDVVLLVACHACDRKPLRIADRRLSVAIDDIIYGSLVISVEDAHIEDVLSEERLLAHLCHHVLAVLVDDDNLRKVRTLADELCIVLLLERDAYEAFRLVSIQLGIVAYHLGDSDRLESCELCEPWICLAILLLESLEVIDGVFCKVVQMVLHLVHLVLDAAELLVHGLCVELRDLPHRLLHELVDVFGSDRPLEKTLVFHHLVEYLLQLCLPCLGVTL